jgi:hypothetical protein
MEDTKILLQKYINTYKTGKQLYPNNKELAFTHFKESLDILDKLKKGHSDKIIKHKQILEDTETECHKYITLTIESSIDTENNKSQNIKNSDLLKSLETCNLDLIKKAHYGEINFNEYIDGQTILHWAIKHGDTSFLKHAFKLGARIDITNNNGNTLLEYACLEQDPNMINFLGQYGADMRKHLYFRDGTHKYSNKNDSIDVCILLKIILSYLSNDIKIINNNVIINKIKLIKNLIDLNEKINIDEYTYNDLFLGLSILLHIIPEDYAMTYLNIITEELSYNINNKLGCPKNKLELIIIHLVPFIEYPFNISIDWIITHELKYIILKIIKIKKNSLDIKIELLEYIWNNYVTTGIISNDYLGCLISQWITKIKV